MVSKLSPTQAGCTKRTLRSMAAMSHSVTRSPAAILASSCIWNRTIATPSLRWEFFRFSISVGFFTPFSAWMGSAPSRMVKAGFFSSSLHSAWLMEPASASTVSLPV